MLGTTMRPRRCLTTISLLAGVVVAATIASSLTVTATPQAPGADPFAFFRPWILVTDSERLRLAGDDVVVRTLPVDDGHLAVFSAARLRAAPDRLVAWTRAIDELKRNPMVLALRRFSDPPMLDDLSGMTLDDSELDAIRKCEPGRCDVKLTASDMASLRGVIPDAGAEWKPAVQEEFRRLVLARVNLYSGSGLPALSPYADRPRAATPRDAFAALVARSPYLGRAFPEFANLLVNAGVPPANVAESFLYWSKERYGAGKNVITVTHVQILRPESADDPSLPKVLVAGKQIFSTHYTDSSLGLTTVVCEPEPGACYLVYLNRSRVDLLGGFFGGMRRAVMARRIESDTPGILREMRRRLEGGTPGRGGVTS